MRTQNVWVTIGSLWLTAVMSLACAEATELGFVFFAGVFAAFHHLSRPLVSWVVQLGETNAGRPHSLANRAFVRLSHGVYIALTLVPLALVIIASVTPVASSHPG